MDANTAAFWQIALGAMNLVVLIATFITLVFYTKYTYDMQMAVKEQARIAQSQTEELIHQRRLSVLPAFVAAPFDDRSSNRINLYNVGKGVALNVVIEDVPVKHELYPKASIVFPRIAVIQPGDKIHPGLNYSGLGDRTEQNQAMNSPPVQNFLNHQDYILAVRFLDVEGNQYEQVLAMSQGKCQASAVKLTADAPTSAALRKDCH